MLSKCRSTHRSCTEAWSCLGRGRLMTVTGSKTGTGGNIPYVDVRRRNLFEDLLCEARAYLEILLNDSSPDPCANNLIHAYRFSSKIMSRKTIDRLWCWSGTKVETRFVGCSTPLLQANAQSLRILDREPSFPFIAGQGISATIRALVL
jgi:hypothetical protein